MIFRYGCMSMSSAALIPPWGLCLSSWTKVHAPWLVTFFYGRVAVQKPCGLCRSFHLRGTSGQHFSFTPANGAWYVIFAVFPWGQRVGDS